MDIDIGWHGVQINKICGPEDRVEHWKKNQVVDPNGQFKIFS